MSNKQVVRKINGKKFLVRFIIIALILSGIFYLQFYMRRASAPQLLGKAVRSVNVREKVIALTFDDGPNPESTEMILSLLDEYSAKATFFVTGINAEKYPEIIEKIIESEHEIGNHSWSHERLTYKSPKFIKDEIDKTDNYLRSLNYKGIIPFRAPYGHKLLILPYILMNTNRTHYLWNIEFNDWDSPPLENMLETLKIQIKPGAILLLHDGYTDGYQSRQATVEFVEQLLIFCVDNDYKVVTVTELESYNP
jgi:peptidoglycan/xylan/chitin deacetylase (PgdA/CDA1 family)